MNFEYIRQAIRVYAEVMAALGFIFFLVGLAFGLFIDLFKSRAPDTKNLHVLVAFAVTLFFPLGVLIVVYLILKIVVGYWHV